jgi:hypothetical protein
VKFIGKGSCLIGLLKIMRLFLVLNAFIEANAVFVAEGYPPVIPYVMSVLTKIKK